VVRPHVLGELRVTEPLQAEIKPRYGAVGNRLGDRTPEEERHFCLGVTLGVVDTGTTAHVGSRRCDPTNGGILGAVNYPRGLGVWGWMVSPRANISTNWLMRLERVSGLLAFPIL
jgi:hypothetical protein